MAAEKVNIQFHSATVACPGDKLVVAMDRQAFQKDFEGPGERQKDLGNWRSDEARGLRGRTGSAAC